MPNLDGEYILLTAEEFKSFLKGELRNDKYLKHFYSSIESIGKKIIHAQKLKINSEILFTNDDDFSYEITLSNCIFLKEIKFNGASFNQLWFSGCSFSEKITINSGNFNHWLWFTSCSFLENIYIYDGIFETFNFTNNSSKKQLKVKGGIFNQFLIDSSEEEINLSISGLFILIKYLSINGMNNGKINISNCNVNIIHLSEVLNSNSLIFIQNIKLYSLFINKTTNLGRVFVSNITIINKLLSYEENKIDVIFNHPFEFIDYDKEQVLRAIERYKTKTLIQYFNNFYESGSSFVKRNSHFAYIKSFSEKNTSFKNSFFEINKSTLLIEDSSLGMLQIKNCEINNFKDILIDSSDLSSVKTINSKFPTKKGRIQSPYKNLYHLYNDLYSVSSKQNNIKEKVEYYTASQANLLLSLKEESKTWNNIATAISLKTSNFYSQYGQNWIRSVFRTVFILGPIFYGLFLWSTKNLYLDASLKGINYFWSELIQYYPQFLNPTHRLSYFDELFGLGKLSSTIDIFSRIFIGVGIFETIRSFRKYVRK